MFYRTKNLIKGRNIAVISLFLLCVNLVYAQSDYTVEPLSFNNTYNNEIFAITYKDGIIFCSDKRTNILVNRVDTVNRQLYHLFYMAQKDNDKWGISSILSKKFPINAHQGQCSVSSDGSEMYFVASDESGHKIYSSRIAGKVWNAVQPFAHNKAGYTTTHPSLSPDGKYLFFASDMPGGYGGFDIYVCERSGRGWSAPENLGPEINTSENEMYPFIQGNGELFFSSNAHGSMGGLDIFSARRINGQWKQVERMGEPINSTADDISYTASDLIGAKGYFASNRNGKSFDVFAFTNLSPFPLFTDCEEQEENDYTYVFEEVVQSDDTLSMKLVWNFSDGAVKYGEVVEHTFASTGVYSVVLTLIDEITNEVDHEVAEYELEVLDVEQPYITVSGNLKKGATVYFDASKTFLPDIDIVEYYWIFGDGSNKKGSIRSEHIYSEPGVYRVQLGIVGKEKYYNSDELAMKCSWIEIIIED